MRQDDESLPSAALADLVDRLAPEIQDLLATHQVPEEAAEEIVYETMMSLALRWHDLRDLPARKRWFLEALEHACRDRGTPPPAPN